MTGPETYLDASALVKLVAHEAEVAGEKGRHVDDHVDLVRPAGDGVIGGQRAREPGA